LIGDSPPKKEDYSSMLALIRTFKSNNGTFNAIDVAVEEHERFVREWMQAHPDKPTEFPPLPEFYRQTAPAYRVLAAAGDGKMWELSHEPSIDQLIFLLVLPKPLVSPQPSPNDYVHPVATVAAPDSELHCQTRKDQQGDLTALQELLPLAAMVVRDRVSGRPRQQNRIVGETDAVRQIGGIEH
jgi:hypothetical protein